MIHMWAGWENRNASPEGGQVLPPSTQILELFEIVIPSCGDRDRFRLPHPPAWHLSTFDERLAFSGLASRRVIPGLVAVLAAGQHCVRTCCPPDELTRTRPVWLINSLA